MNETRKVVAILAADVAGSSRLAGENQAGPTQEVLRASGGDKSDISLIASHGGAPGPKTVPPGGADLILTSTCEWQERNAAPRKLLRNFGRSKR
jgi:hypothetical protein